MSKYTTEVRFICETYADYDESQGYMKIPEIIEKSREKVFDFDFPIFDENYRSVLETKILKHYYLREIGLETVGAWKHFLDIKMNEIMPYYNKLYLSALLEFNPFYDVDITKDHIGTGEGQTQTDGTRKDTNDKNTWDYYSDTPQGSVGRLDDLTYLTDARHVTEGDKFNSVTGTKGTMQSTDQYLDHIKGKQGPKSYSKLLEEYRKTFLNIDMMIIDELASLFMNLW